MIAFIYERDKDGGDKLPGMITNHYKKRRSLFYYGIGPRLHPDKDYNVYIYFDRDKIYGKPNETRSRQKGKWNHD